MKNLIKGMDKSQLEHQVRRAIKHVHVCNQELPLICEQLPLKNHDGSKVNVTMVIRKSDLPFYEKVYSMKSKFSNGSECIIQGNVPVDDLDNDAYYEFNGIVGDGGKSATEDEIETFAKKMDDLKPYIKESIRSNIKRLTEAVVEKNKLLKLIDNGEII